MPIKDPELFNFEKLYNFLQTPKTLMNIQKEFHIKSRLKCLSFINAATYRMLIYETNKIKGIVWYGIIKK